MSHVTTSPSHLQQQQMLPLLGGGTQVFLFVCLCEILHGCISCNTSNIVIIAAT